MRILLYNPDNGVLLDCVRQIPEVTEKSDYLGKGPMASGARS